MTRGTRPAGWTNEVVDARTGASTTWSDLPDVELPAPAAVVVPSSYDALPAVRAHAGTGAELLVVAAGRLEENLRAELGDRGLQPRAG